MRRLFTRFFAFIAALVAICSCTTKSVETQLRQENDSLRVQQARLEEEVNNYFESISQINDNLERIKSMSGYITKQTDNENLDIDAQSRINNNVEIISELIASNNEKIAQLSKQLRQSDLKLRGLEKSIAALSQENATLTLQLNELKEQLHIQTNIIASQSDTIRRYQDDNKELMEKNEEKDRTIEQKQQLLDEVYYVFGSTKELKEQGIVPEGFFGSRKVLTGEFNEEYFIKTDYKKLSQIPLYSKKAKLLTTHPSDSYVLEKQDGQYVLRIVNKEKFWSVSKYLVVDID